MVCQKGDWGELLLVEKMVSWMQRKAGGFSLEFKNYDSRKVVRQSADSPKK